MPYPKSWSDSFRERAAAKKARDRRVVAYLREMEYQAGIAEEMLHRAASDTFASAYIPPPRRRWSLRAISKSKSIAGSLLRIAAGAIVLFIATYVVSYGAVAWVKAILEGEFI